MSRSSQISIPALEERLEKSCAERMLPGVVMIASNLKGDFKYEKSFGIRSLRDGQDQSTLDPDMVMWIASCTKLITGLIACQCIERGLFKVDDSVLDVLPELKRAKVIARFEETGQIHYEDRKEDVTVRHLLTHSSGQVYPGMHPTIVAWHLAQPEPYPAYAPDVPSRFNMPYIFQPGTSWFYGTSNDWLGLYIERITKMDLEDWMQKYICGPLHIKDLTFHLDRRPDMQKRMVDMSIRDETTKKCRSTSFKLPILGAKTAMGGYGVFSTPREYFKIVHAVLRNDGTLMKRETAELLFTPLLPEPAREAFQAMSDEPAISSAFGGIHRFVKKDWSAGGMLLLGDCRGHRKAGTLAWSGLPNLHWFVDRQTGLCGFLAGQLVPTGDPYLLKTRDATERDIYTAYEKWKAEHASKL